jgi:hypothetical protein
VYAKALKLEHDFLPYFTSIVEGGGFGDVYEAVKAEIRLHSVTKIWVTASEMF